MEVFTETYTFVGEADDIQHATDKATKQAAYVLGYEPSETAHLAVSTQAICISDRWIFIITIVRTRSA